MAKQRPNKPDPKELGQMLVNIYESGYLDKNQAYKQSFVKGLISGFAGVLGATVLIALLLWILTLLHHVPFVKDVTDNVKQTVETKK